VFGFVHMPFSLGLVGLLPKIGGEIGGDLGPVFLHLGLGSVICPASPRFKSQASQVDQGSQDGPGGDLPPQPSPQSQSIHPPPQTFWVRPAQSLNPILSVDTR
jgi:hypothetical protein